jgi:hypothetical protein
MGLIQGSYGGTGMTTQPYDRDIGGSMLSGAGDAVALGKEIFGGNMSSGGGLLSAGLGALSAFF